MTRLLLVTSLLVSCESESQQTNATAEVKDLIDTAPLLELGDVVSGSIAGEDIGAYKVRLQDGDRMTVTAAVADAGFSPYIALYAGGDAYVDYEGYTLDASTLTKTYAVSQTGDYLLTLQAYQGEGSGDYELGAKCDSGPCATEDVIEQPGEGQELLLCRNANSEDEARNCLSEIFFKAHLDTSYGSAAYFASIGDVGGDLTAFLDEHASEISNNYLHPDYQAVVAAGEYAFLMIDQEDMPRYSVYVVDFDEYGEESTQYVAHIYADWILTEKEDWKQDGPELWGFSSSQLQHEYGY